MSNNTKTIVALLSGVAVGGVLGLLFAPSPGKKTRQTITDAAQDLSDKIIKKAEELVGHTEYTNGKVRSGIKNM